MTGGPGVGIPSDGGPLVVVADRRTPVLAADDHHHLARVRRVRDGDAIVLTDGRGGWCPAVMAGTTPRPAADWQDVPAPEPPITVAFALVKGAKPDLVVQKLTELGVDRIIPFTAARSVVRWDDAKAAAAVDRLGRIAREAAMQSRRAWLPEVAPVATFAEVAALPGAALADRDGAPPSLDHPVLLVGPEGGWDEAERACGLPAVGLGANVLRAETAAIAAGVLLGACRSGLS